MKIQNRIQNIVDGFRIMSQKTPAKSKSEYVDNFNKVNEKNLKYDFLPSMLEIIEKPENKLSDIILIMILALIVSAVIWASIAKVDMIVTAGGNIMPEGNLVSVINPYGGEVTEIKVKDGDNISKGESIMTIYSDTEKNSLEKLEYELRILKCQKEVYEKIRDYDESQKDESEYKYGINIDSYGDSKEIARAIVAEQELYELQTKEYADNKKKIFVAEHELNIQQNINSIQVKIIETEGEIENTKRTIEEKEIKAPADGKVSGISVTTEGVILPSGQNVCYIIPKDSESKFIAYVKTSDIESLHIGDKVKIRLSSLKDTDYERITGEVDKIGDIAINSEGNGAVYKVEIKMDEVPEEVLKVGIDGSCDIIVGRRTVLMYFMEPFLDGLRDSLHEK